MSLFERRCSAIQIAGLSHELDDTKQKLEAMLRVYEAEAAVASQAAEHSRRDTEKMARMEGRLAEALALAESADQAKDVMDRRLHEAQVASLMRNK